MKPHLECAHFHWSHHVKPGDGVIDATCGNGHDTLKLCELALTPDKGYVYAFDIQPQAIIKTKERLLEKLPTAIYERVHFIPRCHSSLEYDFPIPIRLIVYNLGYLPGSDKQLTTLIKTTLQSLTSAQKILSDGGVISITCYPGHLEGAREEELLLQIAKDLPFPAWTSCHYRWLNRDRSPSLLLLKKNASNIRYKFLAIDDTP